MNSYVSSVGRVCYSWNRLVEVLGHIFVEITEMDLQVAQAIWHSWKSDGPQMEMLKAAIDAVPEERWLTRLPRARKDLEWLMKECIGLAAARNKAIHTPFVVGFGETGAVVVIDPFSSKPSRGNKSSKTTLQDEVECCIEVVSNILCKRRFVVLALGHSAAAVEAVRMWEAFFALHICIA